MLCTTCTFWRLCGKKPKTIGYLLRTAKLQRGILYHIMQHKTINTKSIAAAVSRKKQSCVFDYDKWVKSIANVHLVIFLSVTKWVCLLPGTGLSRLKLSTREETDISLVQMIPGRGKSFKSTSCDAI